MEVTVELMGDSTEWLDAETVEHAACATRSDAMLPFGGAKGFCLGLMVEGVPTSW